MDIQVILNQMLILCFTMMVGYVSYKTKVVDEEDNRRFSKFVLMITSPALIISSIAGSAAGSKRDVLIAGVIAAGMYLILPVIARLTAFVLKETPERSSTLQFMIIFANVGFMGVPVINAIYGAEGVRYVVMYMMMFNVCQFSYGIFLLSRSSGKTADFDWRRLLNPNIIAAIVAMILYIFDLKVPTVILGSLDMVGQITTPMAMIVVGVSLAQIPVKQVFDEPKLYLVSILRLAVIPILMWCVLKPLPISDVVRGVAVIIGGMPIATNVIMVTKIYGGDPEYASKGVFITTACSIVTIPLLTAIL
jgi:predicted permease